MTHFYVYAHTKLDGSIFYIGKGTNRRAWCKTGRNTHWNNVVNKYGYKIVILADNMTDSEAKAEEIALIAHFKKFNCLVNMTAGGDGTINLSEEAKQKIALSSKNRVWTKESKEKLRKSWIGRIVTQKTRLNMSKAQTGKKMSETAKLNMSTAQMGAKNAAFKGKIVATNLKTKKILTFEGAKQMKNFGFCNANVYKCVNEKIKTYKGYTFKREEI
jgi:hypothetical protein